MQQLDRTIAPDSKSIAQLDYNLPAELSLSNGIPVYIIDTAEQDLLRVELLFDAGEWYQQKPLQASSSVLMLPEGTTNYSSDQIAEKLDFYGSFIFPSSQKHTATLTLYSLEKYLDESLAILTDVLLNPTFPEKEFQVLLSQKRQQFLVDTDKVEAEAAKLFMQSMFGQEHPYGKKLIIEDFDNLTIQDLKDFHARFIGSGNCKIIVSGKVKQNSIDQIEKYIGTKSWGCNNAPENPRHQRSEASGKQLYVEKENAVQTALRIGIPMINKTHPDYKGLQVLNTILGGYFGSRLMSNIREDKGYTYGIHSSLASLQEHGYFLISSQVKKEIHKDALSEIYKEVDRLSSELIPLEELTVVKNYMIGQILRYFDGPFNLADTLKSCMNYGLDYSYYADVVSEINAITPEKLMELAKKYLADKEFFEICVG